MAFDYSKLNGRIVEKCGTRANFAKEIGLSEHSVSFKLNNKVGWRQNEIAIACNVLAIPIEDVPAYFFVPKIQ